MTDPDWTAAAAPTRRRFKPYRNRSDGRTEVEEISWRLADKPEPGDFEGYCHENRGITGWKHDGATLVHTTSRTEWERHRKEEHPRGYQAGHLRSAGGLHDDSFTFYDRKAHLKALIKTERELLGRWVQTPRGDRGQIWSLAEAGVPSLSSLWASADVWVVVTIEHGDGNSQNVAQPWNSGELTFLSRSAAGPVPPLPDLGGPPQPGPETAVNGTAHSSAAEEQVTFCPVCNDPHDRTWCTCVRGVRCECARAIEEAGT